MTVADFIGSLKTKNVLVTIQDTGENDICKIYAEGVDALDDNLEAREVSRWNITSVTGITVIVQ